MLREDRRASRRPASVDGKHILWTRRRPSRSAVGRGLRPAPRQRRADWRLTLPLVAAALVAAHLLWVVARSTVGIAVLGRPLPATLVLVVYLGLIFVLGLLAGRGRRRGGRKLFLE